MIISSWLRKIIGVAAPLASIAVAAFAPGLSPVISSIINAIFLAEDKFGPAQGAAKIAQVLDYMTVAAPGLVRSIEQATGKELVDEELFNSGIATISEGVVKLLNAFRLLPKGA